MNKYLFLDIDGVLNTTKRYPNGRHGTDWPLVQRLNTILNATNPKIIVSSAWRWDVHNGNMTLLGFQTLLMRQGIDCEDRLWGVTPPDDYADTRGKLINLWLRVHAVKPYRYVVIDDGQDWLLVNNDHGMRDAGHSQNFVHTNSGTGLTDRDVCQAITILNSRRLTIHKYFERIKYGTD